MSTHMSLNLMVQQRPGVQHRRKIIRQRIRPNRANEMWYLNRLLRIVYLLEESSRAHLFPLIARVSAVEDGFVVGDALPSSVGAALYQMASQFGGIEGTARRLAALAVQRNQEAVDDQLRDAIKRAMNVDVGAVFTSDGAIRAAMDDANQANIELIKSIPAQYFGKLREKLEQNFVGTQAPEHVSLIAAIEAVGDVTESRAKLIARDQTAKMSGAFNHARQTGLGIKRFLWQTAEDDRVRPLHAEHDQQVYSWDEGAELDDGSLGFPGDDINCRCGALAVFEAEEEQEEEAA
jgi:SPP1 gp7 family putative phage head morphogenesis protein